MTKKTKSKPTAQDLIDKLKAKGKRLTNVRKTLLEVFAGERAPVTVPELIGKLSKRELNVNKTTVYRELEFLLEHKCVLEVDLLDGSKRYELLDEANHHHHLVCTKCREIKCIEMHEDLNALEKQIGRKHQFQIKSHVLEFFGVCGSCG